MSSSSLRLLALKPKRIPAVPSLTLRHLKPQSARSLHAKTPATTILTRQSYPRSQQIRSINPSILQCRTYADNVTIKVPPMAESISEGTLKQFLKEIGDEVEQDEEIATIETDKIDVAVNAPEAGVIREFLVEPDSLVTVGQDLIKLEPGAKGEAKSEAPKEESKESEKPKPDESKDEKPKEEKPKEEKPKPEPKEEKPEPKEQKPEPKQEKKPEPKPQPSESSKSAPPPKTDGLGSRSEERVKMTRIRLRTAERLKESQNRAASLTTFNEVDMSACMEIRSKYKDEILEKTGIKLGFMSFFTKAAVMAMKDVPSVNASIEGQGIGDTIVYRDYIDVSIAVATQKGLVTPVIRNAETLDVLGLDKAIAGLGKKARDNKLTLEDLAGGTFTISNGGVFGSMMGTPILNLPQTAVLGLHAVKERPVAINGKVEIRPMMYLALTYDHRLLDGREAVTFLVKLKEYIENPVKMFLLGSS